MAVNRNRAVDVSLLDRHRSPSASEIYSSARKYLRSDLPSVISDGTVDAKERMPPVPRVTPVIGMHSSNNSEAVSPDTKPVPRSSGKAREKLITPVRIRSKSSDVNADMYDNGTVELERSRTDTSLFQGIVGGAPPFITPPATHHNKTSSLPASSHSDSHTSDHEDGHRDIGAVKTVLFSSSKPHRSSAPPTVLPSATAPLTAHTNKASSVGTRTSVNITSEQEHRQHRVDNLPSKPLEGVGRSRQRRGSRKHDTTTEVPPPPPSANASPAAPKDHRQTSDMSHRALSSSSSNSGRILPGLTGTAVESKAATPQVVINNETAARGNDMILQQRLQEAKALNRRDDKGAVMFKFALWGGGGSDASKSTAEKESLVVAPVATEKDTSILGVAPPKKSIRLRGPRAAREMHDESMDGHQQEKLTPIGFTQETASPPKPPPDSDKARNSTQQQQRSNMANAFRNMVVSCKQNQSSVGSNTDASIKTEIGVVIHRSLSRVNSEESLYSLEDETSQALIAPCPSDEEKSLASVAEEEIPDITVDSDVVASAVTSLVLSEMSRERDATPVKYHSSSSFDRYSSFTNSGCNTPVRTAAPSSIPKNKSTPPRTILNRSMDDVLSVFSGISEPFQSLALAPGVAHMKEWKLSGDDSHDSVPGIAAAGSAHSPCLSEISEHDDRFHRVTNGHAPSKSNEEVYINDDTHGLVIHWKKGQVIGEGTFGQVYKGMNNATGELLAIKQICLADGTEDEVAVLRHEINVMQHLKHNNIVRYVGTTLSDRYLYILLEFVPGGSVASMLVQFGAFSEPLIRRLVYQILSGVEYLHQKGIIHRDIKGANVLVTDVGVAKLADFGCSKQLSGLCTTSLEESLKMIRGSVPWMAPEVIRQTGHGRSADIWSLGATVIEMATAKHPWPEFSNNMAALFHVATSRDPPPVPAVLSASCADLLKRCMMIDPKSRASASELLNHVFLAPEKG